MLKRFWKPLILILVVAIMGTDLYLDIRSSQDEILNPVSDLPVGTSVGELAPDITGTTVDGHTIRLSDFRGKIVVVNDFATWCGPCIAETPHLVDAANANQDEAVFIGLNLRENKTDVEAFRIDFQIPYPIVLDPDGKLTDIYLPVGLPTTWFIDPDGVVRHVHAGPMTREVIQEILEAVKEGREPDIFSVIN